MMILWKERLAFLAVPKTGTTAIEDALLPYAAISYMRPPHIKHMSHRRFNRFLRPYLEKSGLQGVKTVAVMREPVSWLGSWYRYRSRAQIAGSEKSTAGISFDDFIEAYLAGDKRPEFANVGSQLRMISASETGHGVDFLFTYENLGALVEFLRARTGRELHLQRSNVSPEMPLSLSAELEARLRAELAAEFDTYASIN
jgi:hypothetical protein